MEENENKTSELVGGGPGSLFTSLGGLGADEVYVGEAYVDTADGVARACLELGECLPGRGLEYYANFLRTAGRVAACGMYVRTVENPVAMARDVDLSSGLSVAPSLFSADLVGQMLDDINRVADHRRQRLVKSNHRVVSYTLLFPSSLVETAMQGMPSEPTLADLMDRKEFFKSAADLMQIGVSFYDSVMRFHAGPGVGALSAYDITSVCLRGVWSDSDSISALLEAKIGGALNASEFRQLECDGHCRSVVLDALGCKGLAVFGSTAGGLRDSPGWFQFSPNLERFTAVNFPGLISLVGRFGERGVNLTTGNMLLCDCWSLSKVLEPGKIACADCGYFVKPDDHDSRCRKRVSGEDKTLLAAAWVGDAEHMLDVRKALLRKFSYADAKKHCVQFISAGGQARFLREVCGKEHLTVGECSDRFEASYSVYRETYLAWLDAEISRLESGIGVVADQCTCLAQLEDVPLSNEAFKAYCPSHGGVFQVKEVVSRFGALGACKMFAKVASSLPDSAADRLDAAEVGHVRKLSDRDKVMRYLALLELKYPEPPEFVLRFAKARVFLGLPVSVFSSVVAEWAGG